MTRLKAVTTVAVIALVLAGVASWLVYDYLSKKNKRPKPARGKASLLLPRISRSVAS